MRYRLAIAFAALQVLVLAFMAGEREWVARTGRALSVRTTPIDPDDPMRGQYARLDYEISHVPWTLCHDGVLGLPREGSGYYYGGAEARDYRVYATLQPNEAGLMEVTGLTDIKPEKSVFIRGRIRSTNEREVEVRYGIEALFMQQGKAEELDKKRRDERRGVPLNAHIAVAASGLAVLRDYSWEPLGITLTFERAPLPERAGAAVAPGGRPPQFITGVNVTLKNYGPGDVAIVDLPDGGSFRLVADARWQETRYGWVGEKSIPPPARAEHVVVLKPGESHTTKIDLLQPGWFVTDLKAANERKAPMALRDVTDTWSASFRIEYVPPSKEQAAGLPHAEAIRHGKLRSNLFSPAAGVD